MNSVPIEAIVGIVAVVQILVQLLSRFIDHFLEKSKERENDLAIAAALAPALKVLEAIGTEVQDLAEAEKERKRFMTDLMRQRGDELRMLNDLYLMHKVNDADGRPVWYFPRRMTEMAEEHAAHLRELKGLHKEAAASLAWVVRKLSQPRPGSGERA